MNKSEESKIIDRLADEMARTGNYQDWLSIESALRSQGYPRARQILDTQFRRQELNEICHQARQK